MQILMTTQYLLSDGTVLNTITGAEHGWPSVKEGTKALCDRWGKRVHRLENGYEDREPNEATGVILRVTFTEVGEEAA